MPNHLKQGSVGVQLRPASRQEATSLALRMGQVGIVITSAAGALEFAADGAGRTEKAFSNGSGGAQVGAHGHDNGALLGSQMFVDFRHGGTLQEKVLHLVFENAMLFADLTPQLQERVVCSISAAIKYEIPANILLAIAEKEAGKPGQWVQNSNGSFDVGALQFNTTYLQHLSRYGITPHDVARAGCYPFDLAAWRLRQHIKNDRGDVWTRAANYHSRTPRYNAAYRADLIKRAITWTNWLSRRVAVYDIITSEKTAPADGVSK